MELKEYGFSLREIKELPSEADITAILQQRYAQFNEATSKFASHHEQVSR